MKHTGITLPDIWLRNKYFYGTYFINQEIIGMYMSRLDSFFESLMRILTIIQINNYPDYGNSPQSVFLLRVFNLDKILHRSIPNMIYGRIQVSHNSTAVGFWRPMLTLTVVCELMQFLTGKAGLGSGHRLLSQSRRPRNPHRCTKRQMWCWNTVQVWVKY